MGQLTFCFAKCSNYIAQFLTYDLELVMWKFTHQFSSVQLLSRVRPLATPWTAACQASVSITNCWRLLKFISIKLVVISSNHLTLYCPLLLLPSIFLGIRAFSNESVLRIRWPNIGSFIFSFQKYTGY